MYPTSSRTSLLIMALTGSILLTGCETLKRTFDADYDAQQRRIEQEKHAAEQAEAEKAYWVAQAVKGSPEVLDTTSYKKLVVSTRVKTGSMDYSVTGQAIVEQAFVSRLLAKGYTIAEREDLDRAIKEMGLQQRSGLTTTEDVLKAGKMLNAEAIMIVDIVKYLPSQRQDSFRHADGSVGINYLFTANVGLVVKLIDIQKGTQVWSASYFKEHKSPYANDPQKALELSAGKVADAFPDKQNAGQTTPATGPQGK